ncbi:MAG: hypothetical protein K0U72_10075 [Gammaproteobacteria bacterium]|nr:hypothetical protein [Gammaproteobacteria bacterium]
MRSNILWGVYFLFGGLAVYFDWHDDVFSFSGPLPLVKAAIWLTFLAFLVYSIYASKHENLFRTIKVMNGLYWGRQIGADLYIGCFLAMFVIYLNDGALAALLWLIPTILFANLSILLYFALNFEKLLAHFPV